MKLYSARRSLRCLGNHPLLGDWKPDDEDEHERLARQFAASPLLPLRVYLAAGLYETPNSTGVRPSVLMSNRHLRDVLRAKGYGLTYVEFNGHHDYVWQPFALADGLKALMAVQMTASW